MILVGGDKAAFDKAQPVLSAMGRMVRRIGDSGAGATLKLINNMLAMTTAAAIAEAMAPAAKAGLSLQKVFDVISAGGVNSGIFQMMVGRMLQGDLAGLKFSIGNAQKDLRYYTHLTEMLPTTSFIAEAAHQSFVQAANLGHGDAFIASLLKVQEQINNVQIVPR